MAVIWVESDRNRLQLEHFAGFCTKLLVLTPPDICLLSFFPMLAGVQPNRFTVQDWQ